MMGTARTSHTRSAAILPTLRLCPACTRRDRAAEIVDPHCPVCAGAGVLKLGARALHSHTPDTVGEAILLVLEAHARITDQALTLSDDRLAGIRAALDTLHAAGLLGDVATPAGAIPYDHAPGAASIARRLTQGTSSPLDKTLTTAEPHTPGPGERPGANGLPVLSRHGHPSSLARITNPDDPHQPTRRKVSERSRTTQEARALAQAAQDPAGGDDAGHAPTQDPLFTDPDHRAL